MVLRRIRGVMRVAVLVRRINRRFINLKMLGVIWLTLIPNLGHLRMFVIMVRGCRLRLTLVRV